MQHDPQPAACNGNCGRVVLFSSRQKLFKHLREKHGVPGFQRRGRESRKRRQEERSPLQGGPDRQQPRSVPGPHKQWIRPVVPRATNPGTSSARGASSPVIGAISPEKASVVDVQGSSLAMSAISPKMGVTSPAMALSQSSETGAILPEMASSSPETGAISSAKASPSPVRAPASANAPPPGSCPVSSETGAISSAKASKSLERAPVSPAMAPTAVGDLPGGSSQADTGPCDTPADAWARYYRQQQSRAQHASPPSTWSAAMAPRP